MLFRSDQQANLQGNRVYIIFYADHYIITALKNNSLLLMQSRQYQTAEDVLYMILNTCSQNNLSLGETKVSVCGMIDIQSTLHTALYMYLADFEIETIEGTVFGADGFQEYPPQYFASFFNYAV